ITINGTRYRVLYRRNGASRVWAASDIEALRQLRRLSQLSSNSAAYPSYPPAAPGLRREARPETLLRAAEPDVEGIAAERLEQRFRRRARRLVDVARSEIT